MQSIQNTNEIFYFFFFWPSLILTEYFDSDQLCFQMSIACMASDCCINQHKYRMLTFWQSNLKTEILGAIKVNWLNTITNKYTNDLKLV